MVNGNAAEIERFTVVYLCDAFLKLVADEIAHEVENSKLRHFILLCVARLVQCDTKLEAVSLFHNILQSFASKKTSPGLVIWLN